ncbi:LacI family DNA-binding transcriptional regulator [Agromyces subbeticus]|uniref:LacI family DNA-binding transcriptional regulator n=1 Tax=Agromyces subbeticus TaxID=293890 RepID=UPI0003B506AB|nr:LacI family DNA-binding transcriptional regulator [Agromyces subbeticus]
MGRAVGIRDVAEAAQVSVGTVSNALNKPDRVSPTTLARVLAVIDELGFVRNDLARQLKMGAGTTLGMIVLNVANPFFADLAHASEAAAEEAGQTVVLGSSDQLEAREDRYLDLFEEQRVRGMLVAPLDGITQRMRRLRARGMPLILFDIHADRDFCSVTLDGRAGGELVARHLIESGRRHIAFLGGPLHQVEDRWLGAQRVCAEHQGVRLTHVDTDDQTIADGRAAGAVIEAMPAAERPDAVFAANDLLALGVLQALVMSDQLSVPRDIAVVGYDDIDYAESAIVPLSTVRQSTGLLAEHAIRLVLDEADDPDHSHEQLKLSPELIVRESSSPR